MNAEDIARSFDFGTYWMSIVGNRGHGKTTALQLLYGKAAAQGQRALFIVPDAQMAKTLTRNGRVKQNDVFTPRSLQSTNGMRPHVVLVDDWPLIPARDRVRVIRQIKMLQPTYVFITRCPLTGTKLALDGVNSPRLWLHDIEPEPVYARPKPGEEDTNEIIDCVLADVCFYQPPTTQENNT